MPTQLDHSKAVGLGLSPHHLLAPPEGASEASDLSTYAHGQATRQGNAVLGDGLVDGGAGLVLPDAGSYLDTGWGAAPDLPATPALHLDAGDLAAGAVASWPDQSGDGVDLEQATGSQQPTCVENAHNGHNVVRFDGSGDFLVAASALAAQPKHAFVVAKYDAATFGGFHGLLTGTAAGGDNIILVGNSGSDDFFNANTPTYHRNGVALPATGMTGPMQEFAVMSISSEDWAASFTPQVGSDRNNGGRYWDGDIAEIIVYTEVLSAADRAAEGQRLIDKYDAAPVPKPFVQGARRTHVLTVNRPDNTDELTLLGSSGDTARLYAEAASDDVSLTLDGGANSVTWSDALVEGETTFLALDIRPDDSEVELRRDGSNSLGVKAMPTQDAATGGTLVYGGGG